MLDLRQYEDREMCKVLVKLAVSEPGANWNDEGYRWSIKDAYVPGWELPRTGRLRTKMTEVRGGSGACGCATRLIKRRAATRSGM